MQEFYTVEGVLASAVATAGTFTIGWPEGAPLGSFRSGKQHSMIVDQTAYNAPENFTVAYTSATLITITQNSGRTFAAGSKYRIQLDVGGDGDVVNPDGVTVLRTQALKPLRINLGAPLVADVDGVCTIELLADAGNVPIDGVQATGGVATLDVPRNVTLTVATTNQSAITFTVYGTDEYGATMIEAITGPNANTVQGKKAFKTVTRVAASAAIATNGVSVGFGDILGLPVFVSLASLQGELQDGAAATAGTLVAGLSVLTKSTATTADVRGTYDPNAAADGARVFEVDVLVSDLFLGSPQYDG